MEAEGDVLGDLQPLAPTGGLPDAELLFADRRPVATRFHGAQKAPRDRVGDRQHCRSGHASSSLLRPASHAGLGGRSVFSKQGLNLAPTRSERHALGVRPLSPGLLLFPTALAAGALFLGAEVEFLDVL